MNQTNNTRNIKKFHNWTKRELINKSLNYIDNNYNMKSKTLLDLAVGMACDINKWYDNNIMYAIGFDFCIDSINEANRRFEEMTKRLQGKSQPIPTYKFYVMDLSDNKNITKMKQLLKNMKFDIVSCQFAIHYFFVSDTVLFNFMDIVKTFIKNNGLFIGTTMNGGKIMTTLNNNNILENNIFKIEHKMQDNKKTLYGNKCSVLLKLNSEENSYFKGGESNEYLVDIAELVDVCKEYNLLLVDITEFDKWYNVFYYPTLYNNYYKLSDEQKEFSFLNFSFTFINKN